MPRSLLPTLLPLLALGACGDQPADPRGVDRAETLLSVSATGEAETRPDQAHFQIGIANTAATARAASDANERQIARIVAALRGQGIAPRDIQTRAAGVRRIDYGDRRGQFEANNIVAVTVRDVNRAGAAVTAATDAGANIVSGPDLRLSNPEKAATSAYGAAYRAARARAEAYADAAGLRISRVLSIRDAGGVQGGRYLPGAVPPPPPVAPTIDVRMVQAEQGGATVMAGQTTSAVSVQVDFALVEP